MATKKKKLGQKISKGITRVQQRKQLVLSSLRTLGEQLYTQLWRKEWPTVLMPSRSITNIRYDKETRQYILGERSVRRSARNIRHIRPLTQLVWTGSFVDELSREGKTSTLRDVFYSAQAYEMSFADQAESDEIITDLETVLGYAREDFNVFPEERSAIFGDLIVEYTVPGYEGKELNLSSHPDGMMIGPALTNAEFKKCNANKVIAIEKGGLFTRFVEERVHNKHKAVLIHTAGQAPRATRALIRRLNQELGLPVYIFCDADPWGMHIANVIISGSANAAHLRELNTPDAKWAGVWASITGDEPVIISKDGLIRNEPISSIVDPIVGTHQNDVAILDGGTGLRALCCTTDGKTRMDAVSAVVRHKYDGPIYELVTAGGYRVKATANHSVQVFDLETCELSSKPVSEIREGDLLAACFRVPNNESVTRVNIAKLLMANHPEISGRLFVVGRDANKLKRKLLQENSMSELRSQYPSLRHGAVKLSYFTRTGQEPKVGRLRLRYSRRTLPITIPVTRYFARLLGYHVAEGEFSGGKRGSCCELTFSALETYYARDASTCIKRCFGVTPKIEHRRHSIRIRYGASLLVDLLSEVLHCGKHVRSKRVPYLVFNFPDEFKMEFLRGYFRGNRLVNYVENTRLGAKTANRLLAADLVVLLRQLGCVVYTYKQGPYYLISVSNTQRIRGLVREICGENAKVRSKLPSFPGEALYGLRKEIRQMIPYGQRTRMHQELFVGGGKTRIGYEKLKEALGSFRGKASDGRLRRVTTMVNNKVVLLPLVERKLVRNPSSQAVYDLEVSACHTFVGGLGGLVLHNSDIVDYKLPSDPLTDLDIKRLYELQKDPRYEAKLWKHEIDTFLKVKRKSEQEAFSRYGLAYIVEKYLPAKLKELG